MSGDLLGHTDRCDSILRCCPLLWHAGPLAVGIHDVLYYSFCGRSISMPVLICSSSPPTTAVSEYRTPNEFKARGIVLWALEFRVPLSAFFASYQREPPRNSVLGAGLRVQISFTSSEFPQSCMQFESIGQNVVVRWATLSYFEVLQIIISQMFKAVSK